MSRIFWDTNLFIYLFEAKGALSQKVADLLVAMQSRDDQLITSAVSLGEVLVGPIRSNRPELIRLYSDTITQTALVVPFDVEAAKVFARLRSGSNISAPDAIQLACAATAKTDLFVTNDERLHRKHVPGIQFITGIDNAPL